MQWTGDVQEQYAYDNSGERVLRRSTSNGTTALTVYAFGLEEHVYDGSGNSQSNTYYYSLGGHLIGSFDGTNTQFFVTDALGSPLATFADAASTTTILGNQIYGPYGNQRYSSGAVGTSKGFTGQYADATGLDYYNARYYDPVVGCFMSADTVDGNGSGDDPYAYVNGNPETATDPTGHYMVGGDGSTANTESDENGGTRVTIHQSDGSTQSTDETGTPDPIPGAPAPPPHTAPAPHHGGIPPAAVHKSTKPKAPIRHYDPTKASQKRSDSIHKLQHQANWEFIAGDVVAFMAIAYNFITDRSLSGFVAAFVATAALVGNSLLSHISNEITDPAILRQLNGASAALNTAGAVLESAYAVYKAAPVWEKMFAEDGLEAIKASALGPEQIIVSILLMAVKPMVGFLLDAGSEALYAKANADQAEAEKQQNMSLEGLCPCG